MTDFCASVAVFTGGMRVPAADAPATGTFNVERAVRIIVTPHRRHDESED
jgi:hypothetical protein